MRAHAPARAALLHSRCPLAQCLLSRGARLSSRGSTACQFGTVPEALTYLIAAYPAGVKARTQQGMITPKMLADNKPELLAVIKKASMKDGLEAILAAVKAENESSLAADD